MLNIVGGGLVTTSCLTFVTPWNVALQAPRSMEFPTQEYWSGLPFPSPGDLPNPGIEPTSPALKVDSLPVSHHGSLKLSVELCKKTSGPYPKPVTTVSLRQWHQYIFLSVQIMLT